MTKDFVADIFGSDPNVFFGFSSTTTNTYNEHSVRIVEICSGEVPTYSPLDGYTTPIDADGSGTVDFDKVAL